MAFAEELWGLLPGATLSGTKVTCGEDLAEVLVGALRRLRGGDPSSTSESSLAPLGDEVFLKPYSLSETSGVDLPDAGFEDAGVLLGDCLLELA